MQLKYSGDAEAPLPREVEETQELTGGYAVASFELETAEHRPRGATPLAAAAAACGQPPPLHCQELSAFNTRSHNAVDLFMRHYQGTFIIATPAHSPLRLTARLSTHAIACPPACHTHLSLSRPCSQLAPRRLSHSHSRGRCGGPGPGPRFQFSWLVSRCLLAACLN
jgi:hypothetical protein